MEKEVKAVISIWIVSLLFIGMAALYITHLNDSTIDSINNKITNQSERTDKLYEMFYDMLKEKKS